MLRKMLLEYIVRPEEVKEFEAGLEEHQRATVEGGGTVLERAVREHNIGACGKVCLGGHFGLVQKMMRLRCMTTSALML